MGWSCTKAAMDTIRLIDALMPKDQRVYHEGRRIQCEYKDRGQIYFYEYGQKEYDDGHICGQVYKTVQYQGRTCSQRSTTFRIEANGLLTRGPALWFRLLQACTDYCDKAGRETALFSGVISETELLRLEANR